MNLILATASDRAYMERITPYLHTIQAHGAAFDRRALITVGCRAEMPAELAAIEAIPLPAERALGHTGIWCVQQGCFLEVLGAADDDVIIFTDGDVALQRGPSDAELAWMRALPSHTVAVGWNSGPDDTLSDEAQRVQLAAEGRALFGSLLHRKIYNCGVVIMRAATYRLLYAHYLDHWPAYAPHTRHYAATQLLLCACIHQLGMHVWELPQTVHTHGCFGLSAGVEEDGAGRLFVGGELVLFRHHWKC